MPLKPYTVGDVARLSIVVKQGGNKIDPDNLKLRIKVPGKQAIEEYSYGTDEEIVRDGPGAFHASIPVTTPGDWVYRWEVNRTSDEAAATEKTFKVRKSSFPAAQ